MVDVSPTLTLVDLIGRPSPPLLCSFLFNDIYKKGGHRPFYIRSIRCAASQLCDHRVEYVYWQKWLCP